MKIILRILITAVALLVSAYLVPGITISSVSVAIVAACALGILHLIARPILLVLTFPITLLTLGLFVFVINALVFLLTAEVVSGFTVDGFVSALLGSIIVSIVSAFGHRFLA